MTNEASPSPFTLAIAIRISRIWVKLANSFNPLSCTLMSWRKCNESPNFSSFVNGFSAASSLFASRLEPAPGLNIVPGRINSRSSVQLESSFKSLWSMIVPAKSTPSKRSGPTGSACTSTSQGAPDSRTLPPLRRAHSAVMRSSPCAHMAQAVNRKRTSFCTAMPAAIVFPTRCATLSPGRSSPRSPLANSPRARPRSPTHRHHLPMTSLATFPVSAPKAMRRPVPNQRQARREQPKQPRQHRYQSLIRQRLIQLLLWQQQGPNVPAVSDTQPSWSSPRTSCPRLRR